MNMKRLQMVGPRKSEVVEVPIPSISDDEMLVKVIYYGVCMSEHYDWSISKGGESFGHEPMGIVEKVGKNITKFKPGDKVSGFFGDGIAQYNVANESNTFKLHGDVRDEDAILEPLACMVSAVSKVPVNFPGEKSVAVVGCGYMGCGAISLLKLRGVGRIVAVDINRESLKNALKYGADEAYTPDELPKEYLAPMENIDQGGFELVFEWGETNESLDLAINMVKKCGMLAVGAYHTGGNRSVDVQLLNVKAIDMLSTHPREIDLLAKGAQNAIDMLASGQWQYQNLPTKIYAMTDFDLAHEEITSKFGKYMKAIIDCQRFDGAPVMK